MAVVALLLGSETASRAGTLLSVDFGQSQSPNPVEPGFSAFNVTNLGTPGPLTNTYNGVTVRLAVGYTVDANGVLNGTGLVGARNRGVPSANTGTFTYDGIYSDFATSATSQMGIQISGLLHTTDYIVSFYVYDNNGSATRSITDMTGATPSSPNGVNVSLGSVTYAAGAVFDSTTPNARYTLTAKVRTDLKGVLTFKCNGSINGLTLENATMLGVYKGGAGQVIVTGNGPAFQGFDYFQKWLGRPIENGLTYIDAFKQDPTSTCALYSNSPYQLIWSQLMIPLDRDSPTSFIYDLSDVVSGAHDAKYTTLAQRLVAGGMGNAIIRLGWEMNGNWYPWMVTDPAEYIAAWRHIVDLMRAVPGAHFKFDYCSNNGPGMPPVYDAGASYPGDDYVDIIGVDLYNGVWNTAGLTPEARWTLFLGNPSGYNSFGLTYWANFAAAHNKPLELGEWGTGNNPNGSTTYASGAPFPYSGNDDPYFIKKVSEWIDNHNVIYANYWDFFPDNNCQLSNNQYPQAGLMFRDCFGDETWWEKDLGTVAIPGNSWYQPATGVTSVLATGTGIGGTGDSGHFSYSPRYGDCSITAQVTSIQNTSPSAIAGVMMRQNLTAGSKSAFLGITQSGSLQFIVRSATGASSGTVYTASATLPCWVRITRAGDNLSAFTSANGTTWTQVGATQLLPMNASTYDGRLYIGTAVSSGANTTLNTSTFAYVNDAADIIMDNTASSGITVTGTWTTATGAAQYGTNFLRGGGGSTSVRYTPTIPETGKYNVYLWTNNHGGSSSPNAPVTVQHAGGTSNVVFNQTFMGGDWRPLGTYSFNAGTDGYIQINKAGSTGTYVIADAVRFRKVQ